MADDKSTTINIDKKWFSTIFDVQKGLALFPVKKLYLTDKPSHRIFKIF